MRWGRPWKHPLFWLGVMVAAFFAVSLYSGIVAYDDFHTHNSTDAGIITQAVSSATYGHQAPFYESYDCLDKDRCSFLLVHPGAILYLAVPFYALAPSTITLFALRSLVVALAAVPLYWLTRQVTHSQGKGLFAAGLYLVWSPTLAGDAFSLHLESLLPVELLTLAALWQAGRYRWGLLAALAAFFTMEIAPVFTFLVGVFFFVPYVEQWLRRLRGSARAKTSTASASEPTELSAWGLIRSGLRLRGVQYTLLLMGASIAAVLALYSFMNVWGYLLLGVSQPAGTGAVSGLFHNPSSPPTAPLATILVSSQTIYTAEYWLILYALVAFLPLLSPRALVISVPWIGYTFLTNSDRFTTLGHQYTMVAAGPMFIGLAYGLRWVPFPVRASSTVEGQRGDRGNAPQAVRRSSRKRRRSRMITSGVMAVLAVTVAANVVLSPISPVPGDLGYTPSQPFGGGYFDNPLTVTPGLAWAEQLVSNIPNDATVAASTALFPLVANDPYAIVIEPAIQPFSNPTATARLPFNLTAGPQFVLMDLGYVSGVKGPFAQNLSNPREYGIRGYVSSSAIGPILLFQRNYSVPAARYGPALADLNASFWPGQGLSRGPLGREVSDASAPEGVAIRSPPGTNATGEVWTGPDVFLPPGNYTLHLEASATGPGLRKNPVEPVLGVRVTGWGPTLLNATFPADRFVSGVWANLTMNFTASSPLPDSEFEGWLLETGVSVAVAYMTVEPNGAE